MGSQNEPLHWAWQVKMLSFTVKQLIFIDESLFKIQFCWRNMAYWPIDEPAQWSDNIDWGNTWAVLPIYTVEDEYLPCTSIQKGFYNKEAFKEWLRESLLSLYCLFSASWSIIYLDNVNIHINSKVQEIIEVAGLLVWYLSSYLSEYNSIELTFSMLKALLLFLLLCCPLNAFFKATLLSFEIKNDNQQF